MCIKIALSFLLRKVAKHPVKNSARTVLIREIIPNINRLVCKDLTLCLTMCGSEKFQIFNFLDSLHEERLTIECKCKPLHYKRSKFSKHFAAIHK